MDDVRKAPRYLEGVKFFDMWDWGWGMPSDPHANENLRHAVGRLAVVEDDTNLEFLHLVTCTYFGQKYRERIFTEARRIARNAARSVEKDA